MNGGVRRWTHGPSFEEDGVRFRLWAPAQKRLALALESRGAAIPMERRDGDFFEVFVERIGAGDLYRFQLSDGTRVPDPASRFQPQDVHGPSETVDHEAYRWRENWRGRAWDDVVLYELHIGAFTPEGSFASAAHKLDHLVDLGATAVEINPSIASPSTRPSPLFRRVGIHIFTFEACSGFTHVTARWIGSVGRRISAMARACRRIGPSIIMSMTASGTSSLERHKEPGRGVRRFP